MKPKIAIACLLAMVLVSCNNKKLTTVSGTISQGANKKIYVAQVTFDGREVVYSADLPADGSFCFKIKNDEIFSHLEKSPLILQLFINEDDCITTIVSKNDNINLVASADNLSETYDISGGEEAVLKHSLDTSLLTFINSVEKLYTVYEKNIENDSVRAEIESKYLTIVDKHRLYLENFIEKHPDRLASYFAFFQSYNRREFFDRTKDIEVLRKINSNLSEKYPESEYIKSMINYQKNIENNTKKSNKAQ